MNEIFNTQACEAPTLMNKLVGCLLYADDLLILSETKEGLQKSLDNLHDYCNTWKLQLNVKKTNVVIFASRQPKKTCDFRFGTNNITIVKSYKYLGVKFTDNGYFTEAVTSLKERGNKAMFAMSRSFYTGITFNPALPLKVFDSTIRPIITYASEVWSCQYTNLISKPSKIDKAPFEQVSTRFCKYVMGLPRQVTNFGVKAELGRKPIFAHICSQVLRYWVRLVNLEEDRLLKHAYLSEMTHNSHPTSWTNLVIKILEIIDA